MTHNKNEDTLLFLLLFTKSQPEKNIAKNICEYWRSKSLRNNRSREYFTTISTEPKK